MKKRYLIISLILSALAVGSGIVLLQDRTTGLEYYMKGDYVNSYKVFSKSAAKNSDAAYGLGMLYMQGKGAKRDLIEAQKWLELAAQLDNANALYNLAYYDQNDILTVEGNKNNSYLKKSADLGLIDAEFHYAAVIFDEASNEYSKTHIQTALKYATLAADKGYQDAKLIQGFIYFFEGDPQKSAEILIPLYTEDYQFPRLVLAEINQKNPELVGNEIINKFPVEAFADFGLVVDLEDKIFLKELSIYGSLYQNEVRLNQLNQAAEDGSIEASIFLSQLYLKGSVVQKDTKKALAYLEPFKDLDNGELLYQLYQVTENTDYIIKAADLDYLPAIVDVYQAYLNLRFAVGLSYDPVLGEKYRLKAAEFGDFYAQIDLLKALKNNYELEQDPEQQRMYFYWADRITTEHAKIPSGFTYLSDAYLYGYGTKKDLQKALKNAQIAYDLNPINSDFADKLAVFYIQGTGIEADYHKAFSLYNDTLQLNQDNAYSKMAVLKHIVNLYYDHDISALISQEQIEEYLEFIRDTSENNDPILFHLADIYMNEGRHDEAIELYEAAYPHSYEAAIHYANVLITTDSYGNKEKGLSYVVEVLNDANNGLNTDDLALAYELLYSNALHNIQTKAFITVLALKREDPSAKALVDENIQNDKELMYQYGYTMDNLYRYKSDAKNAVAVGYRWIYKAAQQHHDKAMDFTLRKLVMLEEDFLQANSLTVQDAIKLVESEALKGSDIALYAMGEWYKNGENIDKDYSKALHYFKQISDPDYRWTESNISELSQELEAFDEIKKRAANKDADAIYELYRIYAYGRFGAKVDAVKAQAYFDQALELGSARAKINILEKYEEDNENLAQNLDKINQLYIELATAGVGDYQGKLGQRYLQGELIQEDRDKAKYWFKQAISERDYYSYYLRQMETYEQNYQLAIQNNNTNAMVEVGRNLINGSGVKKSPVEGLSWIKKAVMAGNRNANFFYGTLLVDGVFDDNRVILTPNYDEAIPYLQDVVNKYQSAAKHRIDFYHTVYIPAQNGDLSAMIKLADSYKDRTPTYFQDKAKALYMKAIDLGDNAAFDAYLAMLSEGERERFIEESLKDNQLGAKMYVADQLLKGDKITVADIDQAIEYFNDVISAKDKLYSPSAYKNLAKIYGFGVEGDDQHVLLAKDNDKLIQLLQAAAQDYPIFYIDLGQYFEGIKDISSAIQQYELAYETDNKPSASSHLFELYISQADLSTEDLTKADYWLEKFLVNKDDDDSYYMRHYIPLEATYAENMANKYADEYAKNYQPDYDKAIYWYQKANEYAESSGLEALASIYLNQKKDYKKAYFYYIVSGNKDRFGDLDQLTTAEIEETETSAAAFNEAQALRPYQNVLKSIDNGDSYAARRLADIYLEGSDIEQNIVKGLAYYEKAGEFGSADAYNYLGNLYKKGDRFGIPSDINKAVYYFDLGAKLNDSNTAHLAGDAYYFGQDGLPQDYVKAAQYFEMTDLEQGNHHALAKYKLALIYYNGYVGNRTKEDLQKAYDLLKMVEENGYTDLATEALKTWDFSLINHQ